MTATMKQIPFEERMHMLRKEIDATVQKVKMEADARIEKGGAEITLAYRSLQLAKMWLGKTLEENGSELPAQYADKAEGV